MSKEEREKKLLYKCVGSLCIRILRFIINNKVYHSKASIDELLNFIKCVFKNSSVIITFVDKSYLW